MDRFSGKRKLVESMLSALSTDMEECNECQKSHRADAKENST